MNIKRIALVLAIVCGLALAAQYAQHYRKYKAFYVDDAAITFTYARNLAQSYGLVCNRGGEVVEGYSNPTWMLLLAAGYTLGVDGFTASKFLGLILGASSILLAFWLGAQLVRPRGSPEDAKYNKLELLAFLAIAPFLYLVVASGSFVGWAASGLENALWVFLLMLALLLHDRELTDPKPGFPWSATVLFLIAITRPEGIAFALVIVLHRIVIRAVFDRSFQRSDALSLVLFVLPLAIYHLWHYHIFAYLLPNTYYAKLGNKGGLPLLLNLDSRGWKQVFSFFAEYRYLILLPLSAIGLLAKDTLRRRLPLLALVLGTIAFCAYTGGDWMKQYRFLGFAQIGIALLAGLGIANLIRWALRELSASLRIVAVSLVFILTAGLVWWINQPYKEISIKHAKKPTATVRNIKVRADQFHSLAEQAGIIDSASLLEPDLGANSYYSGLEMVDVAMLTDVPIARHRFDKRFIREYIFEERKPTFMHIREKWARRSGIRKFKEFRQDYIQLPDWRKKNQLERELGDYVRKDVFSRPLTDKLKATKPLATFLDGLHLLDLDLPFSIWEPGRMVPLTLTWTLKEGKLPDLRFGLQLIGPDGRRISHFWEPIFGWYATSRWSQGYVYQERVSFKVPKNTRSGEYDLTVFLAGSDSLSEESSAVLARIRIDPDQAQTAAKATLSDVIELANPIEAWKRYQMALVQGGKKLDSDRVVKQKLLKRIEKYAENEAKKLLHSGRKNEAIALLHEARLIDPRLRSVNYLLSSIAKEHYRQGRELQKAGNLPQAFNEYQTALNIYPANAWFRKRMEQTRFSRY